MSCAVIGAVLAGIELGLVFRHRVLMRWDERH
jgi:hypothetical protein